MRYTEKIKGYILSPFYNDALAGYFCRADGEIPIFRTIKAAKDYCDEVWGTGASYWYDRDAIKWMFCIDGENFWAIKVEITLPQEDK